MIFKKSKFVAFFVLILLCLPSGKTNDDAKQSDRLKSILRSLSKTKLTHTDAVQIVDALKERNLLDGEEVLYEKANIPPNLEKLPETKFNEVWAYLVAKNENALKENFPITDLVYFSAEVDSDGTLSAVPSRKRLKVYNGRVHYSITCPSYGLCHFVLEPGSKARSKLITQIVNATSDFDGLNMDFENVLKADEDNYISFLADLRKAIGKKTFSVCVPARAGVSKPHNYARIAALSDKVFIMAYDEHWATSRPGPVASMNWCKTVADYGLKEIGADKLVMGLPFYGRSWADTSTARGLVHSTTESILREHNIQDIKRDNGVPTFKYEVKVGVTVFYEDTYSLSTRLEMYQKQGVKNVGFWRLGQEPVGIWGMIQVAQ
ncbi:MAG: hypothetical protein Ta2G_06570 [Termitinemataceae bacterium]|nr:MAG: hypothetical protein Ta2G_06570 [Termitinemataceae bacterium]